MKSLRLKAIKEYITDDGIIDIGTDHGYLLSSLFNSGYKKILAVEKNKGPYDNCLSTFRNNKMLNDANIILSDGLNNISQDVVDRYKNIVIAGMGGDLIGTIINQDKEKFSNAKLILQPNNNEEKLRRYLNSNNFLIVDENILEENEKIYEIIVCKYDNTKIEKLTEGELLFGMEKNYKKKAFFKKWSSEYKHIQNIEKVLIENNKEIDEKMTSKKRMIKNMLNLLGE